MNVKAVKNGNWNDPTVWDTGTLPTSADDVYSNGFVVTLTGNVNVASLRSATASGVAAGGYFRMLTPYNIEAKIYGGSLASTSTLICENILTGSLQLTGSFFGGTALRSYAVSIRSCSNLSIALTGDATGGTGQGSIALFVDTITNCTVTYTGVLSGGATIQAHGMSAGGSSNSYLINANLSGGPLVGGPLSNQSFGLNVVASSSSVQIIGNSTGNNSNSGLHVSSTAISTIVTLTGLAIGSSVALGYGAYNACPGATLRCYGAVAGAAEVGVGAVSLSAITTAEQMIFSQGSPPTNGNVRMLRSDNNLVSLLDENSNTYIITPVSPALFPSPSHVRAGFIYNAGSLVGTLKVPSPENVRTGVATDNTIGTAALTPADIVSAVWGATDRTLTSDTNNFSSEEIADAVWEKIPQRLRNVATVQTVGDQIAAFTTN